MIANLENLYLSSAVGSFLKRPNAEAAESVEKGAGL